MLASGRINNPQEFKKKSATRWQSKADMVMLIKVLHNVFLIFYISDYHEVFNLTIIRCTFKTQVVFLMSQQHYYITNYL